MEAKNALYIVSVLCVVLWYVGGVLLTGAMLNYGKQIKIKTTRQDVFIIRWLWPFIGIKFVLFSRER